MAVAVITGASTGLGREYVSAIIEQFPMVDTFWLIARRKENLKEIAEHHEDKTVAAIKLDLSLPESFEVFEKLLRENEPEIKVLVNAAGYAQVCDFFSSDRKRQMGMIDLNCRGLANMTRLCLPYMTEDSLVVNISSIAAFAPIPRMSVYAGTKAFVHSYSKALRHELLPRGINVISVCPGPMETEFFDVAYVPDGASKLLDSMPKVLPREVAAKSLKAGRRRRAVYTRGFLYRAYHVLAKILPHNWLIHFLEV